MLTNDSRNEGGVVVKELGRQVSAVLGMDVDSTVLKLLGTGTVGPALVGDNRDEFAGGHGVDFL